jgi:hypothetical protein
VPRYNRRVGECDKCGIIVESSTTITIPVHFFQDKDGEIKIILPPYTKDKYLCEKCQDIYVEDKIIEMKLK